MSCQKIGVIITDYIRRKLSINLSREFKDKEKCLQRVSLTKAEKEEINKKWGSIIPDIKAGYPGFEVYKAYHGFDSNFISVMYSFPFVTRCVNMREYALTLAHKGMYDVYFRDINSPKTIVNCINGTLMDGDRNFISKDEMVKIICANKSKMVIKPSVGSQYGSEVRIIDGNSDEKTIRKILGLFSLNFIVQEFVEQNAELAKFNPTSLNTIRISTLLINGKLSILNAVMKFGGEGNLVDNLMAGGVMVGILVIGLPN